MANRNFKPDFIADNTSRIPVKLRTVKEARQLLEELRNAYRSLAPEERRGVKSLMSDLFELQRRFGCPGGYQG